MSEIKLAGGWTIENVREEILEHIWIDETGDMGGVHCMHCLGYEQGEIDRILELATSALREQNRVLAEAFAKTTKGKVTINRYEHGGGRMFVDDGKNRDLIADIYNEGDREFIALCYEVFSKQAALTATSQPVKPQGRIHACDIPGCVSCGNPEDATSQEGQG